MVFCLQGETIWSSRDALDPQGASVPSRLWTSSMLRTIQTAALIPHPVLKLPDGGNWESMSPRVYRNIDEIFAGDCEGMTPDEVAVAHPQATTLRKVDRIGYRSTRSAYQSISSSAVMPFRPSPGRW